MELDRGDQAVVIATGGLASVISGESASIQYVDPNLTLDGLRLIWERGH
jgi:type III pantothenate kinase